MPLYTLAQAKKSRIPKIASCDPDSDEFSSLLNEAIESALIRGDWPETIVPIQVCVKNGIIVWPRYVQRVQKMNHCHQEVQIGSVWFNFVDKHDYDGWRGGSLGREGLRSIGRSSIYQQIPVGTNYYIRASIIAQSDVGKTVTIFGLDQYRQPLRTKHLDGTYTDGIVLTLANPYVQTSIFVSEISRVIKDETNQTIFLYAFDPVSSTLLDIGKYEPGETNPWYATDQIHLCGKCDTLRTVLALVKLAFIPLKYDNDIIPIPSLTALKFIVQSIKADEANDAQGKVNFMTLAVAEMNHVLENDYPYEQTPVDSGFGGESPGADWIGAQHMT